MSGVSVRRLVVVVLAVFMGGASTARGGQREEAARARTLYNLGAYDAAIEAALAARKTSSSSGAVTVVLARARLERFRRTGDPADLASARSDLASIDASALTPRDRVDLEIGLGEALFLDGAYGAAAELFDAVLPRAALVGPAASDRVLDWWASAVDREAQRRAPADRAALYTRVLQRMEEELRRDGSVASASYWLAAAARSLGQLERAWDAAVAGWVRAPLTRDRGATLRADLDRLVQEVIVPERARRLSGSDRNANDAVVSMLTAEWNTVKARWRRD